MKFSNTKNTESEFFLKKESKSNKKNLAVVGEGVGVWLG